MRDVLSRPTMLKSMDTSTWFPAGSAAPCYMSIHALRIISTSRPELSCWNWIRATTRPHWSTQGPIWQRVKRRLALRESMCRLQTRALLANLAAAQHKVQQDEAVYSRAERDRVRWQGLVDGGVVSRSEYDAREAEALADAQQLEADRATV